MTTSGKASNPSAPDRPSPVRSPNHLRVIIIGAIIGFALGGAFALLRSSTESTRVAQGEYSTTAAVGYLGLFGALVFGLAAGVVSVAWEMRRERGRR